MNMNWQVFTNSDPPPCVPLVLVVLLVDTLPSLNMTLPSTSPTSALSTGPQHWHCQRDVWFSVTQKIWENVIPWLKNCGYKVCVLAAGQVFFGVFTDMTGQRYGFDWREWLGIFSSACLDLAAPAAALGPPRVSLQHLLLYYYLVKSQLCRK